MQRNHKKKLVNEYDLNEKTLDKDKNISNKRRNKSISNKSRIKSRARQNSKTSNI